MGIGKNLIDRMYEQYKNTPLLKSISLNVIDYNDSAIKFYKKIGFKLMEIRKNHYYLFN